MNEEMQDPTNLENTGHEDENPFKFSHNQKKLLKAYEQASCNISEACRLAGLSRMCFHNNYNQVPEFKSAIEMLQEEDLDFAESQLKFLMTGQFVYRKKKDAAGKEIEGEFELDALGNPIRDYITPIDNSSVIFKLKTKGKNRGYTYRQEITGAEGNAIGGFEINIVRKNKEA